MPASPEPDSSAVEEETYYDLLDIDEDASAEDVVKAYRLRALSEHPDKGGDKDRFDELVKAYAVLSDERRRAEYDEQLAKDRERACLVQGGRSGGYSKQQLQAPMARARTAPTPGSKRQAQMRISQPGRPEHCAEEWKGLGSGGRFLKMLEDGITEEEKTQKLLDQYTQLPRGKSKKQEWTSGLRGKEKADLKLAAKKLEEQARAKASSWLSTGVAAAKNDKPSAKAKAKTKPKPKPKPSQSIPAEIPTACGDEIQAEQCGLTEALPIPEVVCVSAS